MKAPLSTNEIVILDHHLGTLRLHLDEVANLLESRLTKSSDLAKEARSVQESFQHFAEAVHALVGEERKANSADAA